MNPWLLGVGASEASDVPALYPHEIARAAVRRPGGASDGARPRDDPPRGAAREGLKVDAGVGGPAGADERHAAALGATAG